MKDLRYISVIGMGLLGGSISLAIRQRLSGATVIGYSHRNTTRKKARDLMVATEIVDVLLTNTDNLTEGIDRVLAELSKLRKAIEAKDRDRIEALLEGARGKRAALIKYKIQKKELLS